MCADVVHIHVINECEAKADVRASTYVLLAQIRHILGTT